MKWGGFVAEGSGTREARLALNLLQFIVERMPKHQRDGYSKHFREMAAGTPADRAYIAELIEGKREVPRAALASSEDRGEGAR